MSIVVTDQPLHLAFPAHRRDAFLTYAQHWWANDSMQCRMGQLVSVAGEALVMPYRVYADRRTLVDSWGDDDVRRDCFDVALVLGSRHHDGYFREACVRKLMQRHDAWLLPYVLAPLGEYVLETAEAVVAEWDRLDAGDLARFARDNPAFIARTRRRATSYWDCYYRDRFARLDDYPPWQALCRLTS